MTEPTLRPSIHEQGTLEAVRRVLGVDPEHVRRFRNAIYKLGEPTLDATRRWPPHAQSGLRELCDLGSVTEISRTNSSLDGASKLLLSTASGHFFEMVILRIRSGRTSLCLSSAVGCAAKCRFCATGSMRIARPLTPPEIIEQVVIANRALRAEGRRVRNVVFMGMGEPLHNREAVEEAIARLLDPAWFALSPNHVLLSTVGILGELEHFAARFPHVNLALSLHAARQEVRERLIPLAKHYPVAELRRALLGLQERRKKPVMLEYLMLDGQNDRPEDLEALIEFSANLDVHINLIPYNPIEGSPSLRPSPASTLQEAASRLKAAGLKVTTRFSLGRDVDAACGQLAANRQTHPMR